MGKLKNRISRNNSIDKDLDSKLNNLSESTKIPRSRLMDEAIQYLLDEYAKKQ